MIKLVNIRENKIGNDNALPTCILILDLPVV